MDSGVSGGCFEKSDFCTEFLQFGIDQSVLFATSQKQEEDERMRDREIQHTRHFGIDQDALLT